MKLIFPLIALLLFSCSNENEIQWVKIAGGELQFGSNEGKENEKPEVSIEVNDFFISQTEITVGQFREFVDATKYETDAERNGSVNVFEDGEWKIDSNSSWKDGKDDEPVVFVSKNDAKAFCDWIGGRLPSEIEMEYLMEKSGQTKMNIWSGDFPQKNDGSDGFPEIAPAKSMEADKLGLFHIKGNVWEWCEDVYHFEIHDKLALKSENNQSAYLGKGFDVEFDDRPDENSVIKGGSYLCHQSYCAGFRPEARQKAKNDEGFCHIGFRVVKNEVK